MKRNAAASNSEPAAPSDLTPAAAQEWERITSLLRERKSLDALDQAGLHDYLICWQRLQECEADIGRRGVLVKGYRGALTKNPSVALARQYRESLLAWSKEFGFTLGARSRLAVPQPERPKVNKFALLDFPELGDELDGERPAWT
jgi:P27 family predicted phage terminase small subunit